MIRFRITIAGEVFERAFDAEQVTIGRDSRNDLVLAEPSVAAHHCRIERAEEGWRITAGDGETLLNGTPVTEQALHHEDRIDLGEATLTFIDEREAQALRPVEPLVVPEKEPAPATFDQVRVAPPDPGSDAARSIPFAEPPREAPTKTCPYCGRDIPEAATICRFCQEPLDRKARQRGTSPGGNWSLLTARGAATRGVTFSRMVEWVRDGTVNENSSVMGPTTGFQWRFAGETPRLSKHLGMCHQCGAAVAETDAVCGACRVNLDGTEAGDAQGAAVRRHTSHFLRIVAALAFTLLVFAALAYLAGFTRVGRLLLTEPAQTQVREAIERLFIRGT